MASRFVSYCDPLKMSVAASYQLANGQAGSLSLRIYLPITPNSLIDANWFPLTSEITRNRT